MIVEVYISTTRELIDNVIATSDTISSKEQMIYALGSLDLTYTSLVKNIINNKHIPTLDEVFSRMRIHE